MRVEKNLIEEKTLKKKGGYGRSIQQWKCIDDFRKELHQKNVTQDGTVESRSCRIVLNYDSTGDMETV